ncbi:MAG: M14 family zinc carboxypeptidase, partial [Saprospiraceae bacterium]
PFSEPETRMMRDFEAAHQFIVANHYHTYGNLLIYPWAYNDTPADSTFIKLARLYTRENHYKIGTTSQTVGYAVNGDSNDWLYSSSGTYAFTAEIGKTGFWPQPDEIEGLNQANLWQNLAMGLTTGRFGILEDHSQSPTVVQTGMNLPLRITRYGLEDGPLTAIITPVSANIVSASSSQSFNLTQFQSADFTYDLELPANAQPGDDIVLLLQIDNGSYIHTDTLRKIFGGQSVTAFTDPADNLDNWTGDWGTTTESFVSAPTSITDSPNGPYAPNTVSQLVSQASIAIPAYAIAPQLRFWAHWEIEKGYDFAQVQAIGSDNSYSPLCGRYTIPGNVFQDLGQPIFDGYQYDWVEECMDLSAFKGLSFYAIFLLASDSQDEYDGFYFDDMRVVYQDSVVGTQVILPVSDFRLRQNQPNPAGDQTRISWENEPPLNGAAKLVVFNVLGGKVWEQIVQLGTENSLLLNTKTWSAGLYTYFLQTPGGQTQAYKMTVLHR